MTSELEIVRVFRRAFGVNASEDVEFFTLAGSGMVVSTDTLTESADLPPGFGLRDAGRKSVACCVSDFAAKGVRPRFGVISATLPYGFTKRKAVSLARGIAEAATEFGLQILGGDTGGGRELVLQVTLLGAAEKIVPRGGAEDGDAIYVTGSFGYAAAGRRIIMDGMAAGRRFAAAARRALLRPKPPVEFGARYSHLATSAMDSSDGLSACLIEMASQSGMMFVLDRLPASHDLIDFADRHGIDPDELILNGGEEYEIVFTAAAAARPQLESLARADGVALSTIGSVRRGTGAYYISGGKMRAITSRGWSHFSPSCM